MPGKLKRTLHPQISEWLRAAGLPNLSALAKRINPEKPDQMHVYRVLGGENKHKHILTLLKLSRVFYCDLDDLATNLLDFGPEYAQAWIRLQMIKNQIPSVRQLGIRMGVDLSVAQNIESGKYEYIQICIYRDICRSLGISLQQLMGVLLEGTAEQALLNATPKAVNLISVSEKREKRLLNSYELKN